MNKDLLEITALWLEAGAPERKFNMSKMLELDIFEPKPKNWCGTTCCIAGYVWQIGNSTDALPTDMNLYLYWGNIEEQAAELLGLDYPTAHSLFYPRSTAGYRFPGEWDEITAAQAARAVRNVMERGAPYWEEILDFDEEHY